MTWPFSNYRILFTPLIRPRVYGSTVDVTQNIDLTDFIISLNSFRKEVDNGDFDIGIFTFGSINVKCVNYDNKFNNEHDAQSIFPFTRDLCKVEVRYYNSDGSYSIRFRGLINEDATKQDLEKDTVTFKVLSMDSVLNSVKVSSGAIIGGDLFSTAIKKILNVPEITNILNYSPSNINVALDLEIDDGGPFDLLSAYDAINLLLLASNSVLTLDNSDNIFVKSRSESATVYNLYGRGDDYGRENIISIKNYNNGTQRAFSSVVVNETQVFDQNWIDVYGFRQKTVNADFITTKSKEEQIANNILNYFKVPKQETEIEVITSDVEDADLLDLAKVHFDYRYTPASSTDILPILGQMILGSAKLPFSQGSFRILNNVKWKIISFEENPSKQTTTLKLRQAGTTTSDGIF